MRSSRRYRRGLSLLANIECYPIHYPHGRGLTSSGKPGATDADARSTVLFLENTLKLHLCLLQKQVLLLVRLDKM